MYFLKLENGMMGVLIAFNGKHVEFWLNYEIKTNIGSFHDNSDIPIYYLSGMKAKAINLPETKEIMQKIANATSGTSAGRYSVEIKDWLKKYDDDALPF